jgi:DNA-binding beta-propeller fold protein YncE
VNKAKILRWSAGVGFLAVLACTFACRESPGELSAQVSSSTAAPLRQIAQIDLPGPPGKRFDYLTIDYADHYLLSNHLAAGILYVIDTRTNRLVKAISDVPGAEGVVAVPELHRAYTADWYENKVAVIDLQAMKIITKLPAKDKPDGIAYAAGFHKIYVSDERGHAATVIDTASNTVVKTLTFDSETGNVAFDEITKKIYVNLQDKNVIAVIEPINDTVIARWPVEGCKSNHGMALDAEHHRAFLSCEENDVLAVFDLDKHVVIAHFPMARGADVIAFDPGLRRIYVACGSGALSIFQQNDPDHYSKLQDFPVQRRVHSLAVDRQSHRVYAPEEQEDGRPVARIVVYDAVPSQP